MSLRRNILIFHQAALGDFIVTWPLALALARMFPQSRVHYVTASSKGKLAEKVLRVESLDVELGWHTLFAESADLSEAHRKSLAGAQLLVCLGSRNETLEQNLRAHARDSGVIWLNTKPDESERCNEDVPEDLADHVTTHLLHQLRAHPAIHTAMSQILRAIVARGIAYRRTPQNRIVVHPGAGKPEKCWPIENFVALAEHLRRDGQGVRLLLGEAELEKWPADAIRRVESVAEVHRPTSYVELLNEIAQANVFIGNDSGPGHLAAIVGVPTVSIFGSSPDRWKPIGPRVTVIGGDSMDSIKFSTVLGALRAGFKLAVGS